MQLLVRWVIVFILFSFHALYVHSATFTVTNTNDSGPGSLRQAIDDANANIGLDNIAFNILGSGDKVISLQSPLSTIEGGINIDGKSQPNGKIIIDGVTKSFFCFTLNNPSSSELPSFSKITDLIITRFSMGIYFYAGPITVTNIELSNLSITDCNNYGIYFTNVERSLVNHCTINNVVNNGIFLVASNENIIQYNKISECTIGIELVSASRSNILRNNSLYNNREDGITLTNSVKTKVISNNIYSNIFSGLHLRSTADSCVIANNLIGLDSTYSNKGNLNHGIFIEHPGHNNVVIEQNTIGYNKKDGISIFNMSTLLIISNYIGVTKNGDFAPNDNNGINILNNSRDIFIGNGTALGENKISNNLWNGVFINDLASRIDINRNVLENNVIKTINLDMQGNMSWGNNSKVTPSIVEVLQNSTSVTLKIKTEITDTKVQVYQSNSTNRDLKEFLVSSTTPSTPGNWILTIPLSNPINDFAVISNGNNFNSSEVGINIPKALVVTNTNDSGVGSLRDAILAANINTDTSRIVFNIVNEVAPHVIRPLSLLPIVKYSTIFDGSTDSDSIIIDGSLLVDPSKYGLQIGDPSLNFIPNKPYMSSMLININFKNLFNGINLNGHDVLNIDASSFQFISGGAINARVINDTLIINNSKIDKCSTSVNYPAAPTIKMLRLSNSSIKNSTASGLYLVYSIREAIIENSIIGSSLQYGIQCDGASGGIPYITLKNNTIYNNILDGIYITRSGSQKTLIESNVIGQDENLNIAGNRNGINIVFSGQADIINNVIVNNREHGILLSRVTVRCNKNYIGIDKYSLPKGNLKNGINASDPNTTVNLGTSNLSDANVIGENLNNGLVIQNGIIQKNYIGVDTNQNPIGNKQNGVVIFNSGGDVIVNENIIAANSESSILVNDFNTKVTNNLIGLNSISGKSKYGIRVSNSVSNNLILNNLIVNHDSSALYIGNSSFRNKISKNILINSPTAIFYFSNTSNQNKSAPQNITTSKTGSGLLFNGTSTKKDTIELFTSSANPQTATKYLGYAVADASGNWSYTLPSGSDYNPLTTSYFITTATDTVGNTSRLSNLITVEACQLTVTNTNDSGVGSLRDCIECANVKPGKDTVRFAIPGTGPYVIKPTTSYSNIGNVTDQLVILGNSQASSGAGSGDQTISISGELLTPNLTTWLFINTKTSSINFNVIPDNDIKVYASTFSNVHFNNVRGIRIGDPYNALIFNRGNFEFCTFENMENGPSFNVDGGAAVNLKVNNCYFLDVDQPISGAFYGDSVSITNSFFGKDKNGVITGNKGGISFGLVNNIRIENNEIYVTTERGSAIYMSACRNVEIKNNIIEQVSTAFTATPLIQLVAVNSNSGNYSNKVVLSGNTIRNAQNESVLLVSSDSMEIYGNTIINGLRNGIILNGINQVRQIKNNTITNHTLNGIHIGGAQMIDSIIQNTISNCDQGLSLSGINYPIKINANTFSDCRQYGLYLNGSVQNSTCTNNVLTQNTIGGIYNAGSTSNNLFINNRVLDNGTYGILNSDGSQLSTFRNNIIRNHPIGMELRNSSSSNRIDSNVFINNSTALQVYNGSSSNVISNNSFEQGTIQIKMYNGASGNLLTRNTFVQALQAIDLTLNDVNLGVGNNAKDTASISSAVKNSNSLILSGTGIDNDTIEVFTNNKTKENALTYVGKTRVVGGVWSLNILGGAGYNPLANNHYVVTATDVNNNTSQLSNYFSVPIQLTSNRLNLLPKNGGICLGESYTLDAVIDSVGYRWYRETVSSTPIATTKQHSISVGGNYIIEVDDSFGNTASDTISVIANSEPLTADFLMPSTTGIDDITVVVDISFVQPDSTVWNWGGATAVKGIDNYTLSFPSTGSYTVQLISYLGACAKIKSSTITVVPGRLQTSDPIVYPYNIKSVVSGPNPVFDQLDVEIDMANLATAELILYNQMGAILQTINLSTPALNQSASVNFVGQPAGIYYLRITSGPDVRVIKVVK